MQIFFVPNLVIHFPASFSCHVTIMPYFVVGLSCKIPIIYPDRLFAL